MLSLIGVSALRVSPGHRSFDMGKEKQVVVCELCGVSFDAQDMTLLGHRCERCGDVEGWVCGGPESGDGCFGRWYRSCPEPGF